MIDIKDLFLNTHLHFVTKYLNLQSNLYVNDKDSRINNLLQVEKIDKATLKLKEERAYAVLDEIRVSPNVWYLRKVRNKKIA